MSHLSKYVCCGVEPVDRLGFFISGYGRSDSGSDGNYCDECSSHPHFSFHT
jgi:hypothetical protein